MKPDWDRLGEFYHKGDAPVAQIIDVDFTVSGNEELCGKYGVQGYPTIKYFNADDAPKTGKAYEGGRDYNSLKKFVRKLTKPPCVVATNENCSKKELAFIEEASAWDVEKMKLETEDIKSTLKAAEDNMTELDALFEEQKTVAMATMEKSKEAKTTFEDHSKKLGMKKRLLDQLQAQSGKTEL